MPAILPATRIQQEMLTEKGREQLELDYQKVIRDCEQWEQEQKKVKPQKDLVTESIECLMPIVPEVKPQPKSKVEVNAKPEIIVPEVKSEPEVKVISKPIEPKVPKRSRKSMQDEFKEILSDARNESILQYNKKYDTLYRFAGGVNISVK